MADNLGNSGDLSDDMAEYLQTFLDETEEQLDDLVDTMLALERDSTRREDLNEAFRLIHSIKGSAGMMGFENISNLTHHLENRFDQFRAGREQLDEPMMNIVLRCIDFLRQCVERLRAGQQLASSLELLSELKHLERHGEIPSSGHAQPPAESPATRQPDVEHEVSSNEPNEIPEGVVRIMVRFRPGLQLADLKAQLILNRLAAIGEVQWTRPDRSQLSGMEHLDTLEVQIETDLSAEKVRAVVDLDGVEEIELTAASLESTVSSPESSRAPEPEPELEPEPAMRPEHAPKSDSVVELDSGNKLPVAATAEPAAAISEEASEFRAEPHSHVADPVAGAASQRSAPTGPMKPTATAQSGSGQVATSKVTETMRVETHRLDNLVNLAGELVVNRARFEQLSGQVNPEFRKADMLNRIRDFGDHLRLIIEQLVSQRGDDANRATQIQRLRDGLQLLEEQPQIWSDGQRFFGQIGDAIDQLSRVSQGLQRGILETRMVPVGPLFNRFKRVVRDLSKERGKQVNLVIRGEKTELDKRMVDELGDPLVHLIRNSIDHAMETVDERIRLGKSDTGNISLDASHSGNVVKIQVRDDGSGIDLEKIKSKLSENQLLSAEAIADLSDQQALEYIWHPGFSTAQQVTDVSGRGVGMDVVKTRIQQLSGTIQIESSRGQGTTFTIRLPLTLAIINCLLVRLHDVIFCMPIEDVREIVSIANRDVITVLDRRSIDVRGEFIPLFGIDDVFHWHDVDYGYNNAANRKAGDATETFEVVVLQSKGKTIGLRTDEFLGNQDMVVKSLSDNFINIRGLSGASILGDGGVCLMLDVGKFIEMATQPD